ncbi:hypothetical protein PSMK_15830 [Phycisphaera mikurensis NBRC 102666]|uniref:Protein kinase domain-containing protein n=1 Tax=Phycisphaera mikurensis (strain NBRC 102666 / KCTC 22515 / FYK2301M01) TaxID=1142394 RepID=I0IEQ4_PHYMF|nr:hypothetical protein PSMK_15830 [Phycisphaera mikurensis NBRC 102666]
MAAPAVLAAVSKRRLNGQPAAPLRPLPADPAAKVPQADARVSIGGLPDPDAAFRQLRWGGRLVALTRSETAARHAGDHLGRYRGLSVEAGPYRLRTPRRGFGWLPGAACVPGISRGWHGVTARRTGLVAADEVAQRFTFDVRLERVPSVSDEHVVAKTVPTYRQTVQRLRERFPDAKESVLMDRAGKLVKRVFPVFLTREAAFLQLLQRDMPEGYRHRVPRALAIERSPDGTVQKLFMSWLRLGGDPLSHLDFAEQSADLLRVLHDFGGVIHLDLRLDNMVIHDGEVCFVDFGSAVRVGEDLDRSPMLKGLFHEMMQTSQIQRTLGKMKDQGHLTSGTLLAAEGRVDKAVDLFYLALQISRPYWNPDLVAFIDYDETSEETRRLKRLTDAILRPPNVANPDFNSAADVLAGVARIRERMGTNPAFDRGRG